MSFFDKIKSAVMGNPVTREYELVKHVASAGPGLLWKVHSGFKKSSKQEVSIFVFDKKTPEFEKMPKKQREAIYDMLKKGPTHLIKLRHPRLLRVEHQVEESGDTLAFVTEPIFSSLANLLGHYDNMPSPLPLVIKEHQLHPIELQYGLMQVAEALNFLHSDVKMMHCNLTPHNVVVSAWGHWKLMGFNFSCFSQYQSEAQTTFAFREWDTRKPVHTNPSLDYLAPEYVLSKSCSPLSDVFSLGMLIFASYNGGRPLYENNNNMLSFKKNVELVSRISESALCSVPAEFKTFVRGMLAVEPSVRPDALQITKNAFFEEVAISTLKYLDSLFEKKDIDKSQFFKKSLARVITKLPKRVVHQRVLPPLSDEFRNHKMIPFVLPLVLLIAEDCTLNEYSDLILPVLAPAMKLQSPIQVPLIFLQKMDLLLKMTSQEKVQQHVLPMITQSLEADHSQLQELCVTILPSFASMVDYSSMKHSIIPRITALCLAAKETSLRVKCLVSLGQMLDILDKHIVLDHILPTLHQISSREPGVLMAMLGIYHQTLTKPKLGLDKKTLAETIIPFLLPISIEPSLNLSQFNQFMKVIREMLAKVETEQQAHLDQLSKMEHETKSTVAFAREVAETKAMDDALSRLEGMFAGTEPKEEVVTATAAAPRRGDTSTKSGSFTSSPAPARAEKSNFLAGMNLNELSSTFASNSTFPKTNESPSTTPPTKVAPPTKDSTQFSADILQPTKPSSSSSSSYQPPPVLKPQAQKKEDPATKDSNLLSGLMSVTPPSAAAAAAPAKPKAGNTSGSWSSDILKPTLSDNPANSASLRSWSVPSSTSTGSTNSGVQQTSNRNLSAIGSSVSGGSGGGSGMFSGMSVNQSQSLSAIQQGSQQMMVSGQPPPLVSITQQSSTQPVSLQPMSQLTPQGSGGSGWSAGMQGSSSSRSGMGWNMNQAGIQGGWSGNIGGVGSGNVSSSSSGSGWSPGMQTGTGAQQMGGGMGMGQQQGQMGGGMGIGQQQGQMGGGMGMGQQQGQMGGGMGMGRQQGQMSGGMGIGQQQLQMGGGMGQQGQMGGSGLGMGQQQGMAGSSTGMGFNLSPQKAGSSMHGTGQQSTTGVGKNWSSSSMQQQQQQVNPASLMGGAQPLIATPSGCTSSNKNVKSSSGPKPSSGPNPFANLDFLA